MYYEFEIGDVFYEAMEKLFYGQLNLKNKLKLSKVEFDHATVQFVDATRYRTTFDKGLLYIATTRAMHQ